MDRNLNILLGVTGSVATIKASEVVREMKKISTNVTIKLITTQNAKHFLPQDIIEHVEQVLQDSDEWKWKQRGDPVLHIDLTKWADIFIIAPLDALTLSKISTNSIGIAFMSADLL